ncbi:MAG: bifunctional DNA primase/polymerase [Rhodospirillales bacterium]|nr:bifunctional DNA primase/polymerase [Rhodospirillales bacterium]
MADLSPLDAALHYLSFGWSVIPLLPRQKQPLVRWQPYQRILPSVEQVKDWFTDHPDANVGIGPGRFPGWWSWISTRPMAGMTAWRGFVRLTPIRLK